MKYFYERFRGNVLFIIPRSGFFVVFWSQGLFIVAMYILITSYLGSSEYLGMASQNIIDKVATVVGLVLLAPLGMSIEDNEDFKDRRQQRRNIVFNK